jgi:hypothetical protein
VEDLYKMGEGDYIRNKKTGETFIVVSCAQPSRPRVLAIRSVDITDPADWERTYQAIYRDCRDPL